MSAKLVVHKFESNIYLQSLQIIITDGEKGSCRTLYSEWTEGKALKTKKEPPKSRLVVKIVSDNELNYINLDSCAKELSQPELYVNNLCNTSDNVENFSNTSQYKDESRYSFGNYSDFNDDKGTKQLSSSVSTYQNLVRNFMQSSYNNAVSPLEHSLEKVKENNARIMENIHLLNRTLNYTKKKEILETEWSKDMRFPCNSCGKCFVYKTGLKRHYSTRHAMAEIHPRWQVVWTCIECFQVWPQQNLAIEHSSKCCTTETSDCVREIKTSSLLQCEFCEKVYTSIPRLLRHSKLHTTANNYECNACESSFPSYKAAEQHWLMCPWLKMYYSFSLPKMLLCNACDRKFRNYEQLYNHRYKMNHFMTKTHIDQGVKHLLLVHQCEICAQWFISASLLQTHRNQNHSGYECYDPENHYKMDNNNIQYENHYIKPIESDNQMGNYNNQQYNI